MSAQGLDLNFGTGTIGCTMQNAFAPSPVPAGPTVTIPYDDLAEAATRLLTQADLSDIAEESGQACAFLEACAYPGLTLLFEALDTTPPEARRPDLVPDTLGLDLENVSCVFLGPRIARLVEERGRLFLRNVRHGLYLVPFSINANIGIGCPVDPAFALGGERTRNPYEEKLAAARQNGIAVAESLWTRLHVESA
jgi:hypothetical protein